MRRPHLAALVAACAALAACSAPAGPGTPSPSASGTPLPAAGVATPRGPEAVVTADAHGLIRGVDLGSAAWADVYSPGVAVALEGGTFSREGTTWTVGTDVVYADANGDGELDALADIVKTSGGSATTYSYIWLWDAGKRAAVQVVDPVARYSDCHDTFVAAEPDPVQGFRISSRIRDFWDHSACGTRPKHRLTRTVVVDEGRLLMTAPTMGYGGVCQPTYNGASEYPGGRDVYAAPTSDAVKLGSPTSIYWEMPDESDRTWPHGWRLVAWQDAGLRNRGLLWGVCGFAYER